MVAKRSMELKLDHGRGHKSMGRATIRKFKGNCRQLLKIAEYAENG